MTKKPWFFVFLFLLCSAVPAKAWNCSDPLAERVLVPSTTTGTFGDGDGQLANYNGQVYECEVVPVTPPAPPTTGGNSNANSQSSSTSQAASQSSANSSATGGRASSQSTATGGNATGGNGYATVSNAGNSTVTSSNTAMGGTGGSATANGGNQKQTQTQSVNNSGNSSASANGSNNATYTENIPRQAPPAMAPTVLPTTPCFKGYSGGGSGTAFGFSFGGGKIDENCAILEAARLAPSVTARCKVYLTNKYVKAAGVTMDDCLPQAVPVVVPTPAPVPEPQLQLSVPDVTVNIPVTVIPAPVVPPAPSVAAAARKMPYRKPPCKCVVTNDTITK